MIKPLKSHGPLTSTLWLNYVIEALKGMGMDGEQIARNAGFDINLLANPDAAMPDELVYLLFHKAKQLSGKSDFGLQAAKKFRPSAFGAMGYSMMTAPTLEDALVRTMRYAGSITQACTTHLFKTREGGRFEYTFQPPALPDVEQTHEFLVLFTVNFLRWLVGFELNPIRVDFSHPLPENIQEHRRYFGCPLHFSSGHTAILFSHEQLALPLITADTVMAAFHDRHAEERTMRFGSSPHILQTRRLITQMLPVAEPTRQQIAALLNLSERTLQRRLLEEGASFNDLLDEIRRGLAQLYLANTNITLSETGNLLGYKEQSSFNRAVRRWFQATPQDVRDRLLDRNPAIC